MADDLKQLAEKMTKVAAGLTALDMVKMSRSAANDARGDALEVAAGFAGAGRTMRGYGRGKRRGKVPLGAKVMPAAGTASALVPTPAGPWALAEKGSKGASVPRMATLRGGLVGPVRKRGKGKTIILATPQGPRSFSSSSPMRVHAQHGHETWTHVSLVVSARTPARVDKMVQKLLASVFSLGGL